MVTIGIDLGTTNSACGVFREGKTELIPNRLGDFLTPSVVGFDEQGEIIVGRTAKERLINHGDSTVAVFKRLMGTQHKIKIAKKQFTATELSSILLKSLKEDAETFLGKTIERAVISVPAYFNDNQRHATKLAGELAGLKVDRLINEPTAAALAYGLHEQQEGTFLILDMGGGTFDVSILEFFEGVMEVHASAGDNFLGGEDFVELMVNNVLESSGFKKEDLSNKQLHSLTMKMETVKRRIDISEEHTLTFEVADKTAECSVSQQWFNKITTPLLLRVKRPIVRAMSDAQLTSNDIDGVILVGGSTRLKIFRNLIGRLFGRLPSCTIDPDLVVAQGATIQAGLLDKNKALDDIVLTDVCPYTLGTEVNSDTGEEGGYFFPIIERNSVVPISIVRSLQTAHDNQREAIINIFQGENRRVSKNIFLGSITVKVPKANAGKELIDVRYSYDMNGLLEVETTVRSSQKVNRIVIEHSPGALSQSELKKSLEKLGKFKFHPRDHEENRALLAKGERLFETSLGERRDYIAQIMADFDKILNRQQPLEIKKYRQELHRLLEELDTEEWQ